MSSAGETASYFARAGVVLVAAALFLGALAYPAVGTCQRPGIPDPTWFDNSNILLFGWLAAVVGQIGWYANVPFAINAIGLLRDRQQHPAVPIIQAGLLLTAIVTLQPSLGMKLPHNEAFEEPICRLGPGVWMWAGAQALVLAMALARRWLRVTVD